MSLTLRTALTSLSLAFALSAAVAQPTSTSGRWGWAAAPFPAGQTQSVDAQAVDAARNRLYLLARLDTAQQLNGATVAAGTSLHTLDATTGQWLSATPIASYSEGLVAHAHLTVDAASGDLILAGQYGGTLHLGTHTLTASANPGFVARFSPVSGQWQWAAQITGSTMAAAESAVVLPNGDIAIAGSSVGDSLQIGPFSLHYPARSYWVCRGFAARLNGTTGQWQWASLMGGRDAENRPFMSVEPGNMHRVAFDATTNELLLTGNSDTTATFGPLPALAPGAYLARLNASTGLWVRATALPGLDGVDQLKIDSRGNTYVAGTNLAEVNAVFIARLNAADQQQWVTREPNMYGGAAAAGGGMMWQSVGDLSVDSWGNAFITTHPNYFALCGTSLGGGGGAVNPPTPVVIYNFDTFTGTRLWRLESNVAYTYSSSITADDRGRAYVSGAYSMGNVTFTPTVLPTVSSLQSRLFIAQVGDAATISRVLAAPHDHQVSRAFEVWPNPAHETVQLLGTTAPTATLLDAVGRVVRSAAVVPGQTQIDLTGLAPGVYSLRCGTAVRRLVIE